MKNFAKFSGKLTLAALPIAFGSMLQKAYGKGTGVTGILDDTLNFALTLEYLESNFYIKALASSNLIPAGAPTGAITTISNHETAHVNFLRTAITSLNATPVTFTAASFNFERVFADVFTNYQTFLAVAQVFEDTGVRAYKGQAGNLMSNNDLLTAALNIHSVEARHASHIRQMRKANGADVKPWITGNNTGGIGSSVAASYAGEEETLQAGISIVNVGGATISAAAASEAFDEPLTKEQVTAIVTPFFA